MITEYIEECLHQIRILGVTATVLAAPLHRLHFTSMLKRCLITNVYNHEPCEF